MKSILVLIVLVSSGLVFCQDTHLEENEKEFENEFHIMYNDKKSEDEAAAQLAISEKEINENNKLFKEGKSTFTEKLNDFSDVPKSEFAKEKLGLKNFATTNQGRGLGLKPTPLANRTTDPELEEFYRRMGRVAIPAAWDSREQNLVTPIKNQESCGSCAAFAATALHETCMLMSGAQMNGLDLSEQYLVDCGYNGNEMDGCEGASAGGYQTWFAKNKGQAPHEVDYPYLDTSPKLKCPKNANIYNTGAYVAKSLVDYKCNEDKMAQLLSQYGAVSTCIYASDDSFGNLGEKIFSGCSSTETNHAVTVVGYGTDKGKPFWVVKNSWGTNWGINGFFKIKRGSSECGIGADCIVSSCAKTSGKPSEPPVAPPPAPIPASQICDVTKTFGKGITGKFTLKFKTSAGKEIVSDVTCTNSMCRPSIAGPSNACKYICGDLKC